MSLITRIKEIREQNGIGLLEAKRQAQTESFFHIIDHAETVAELRLALKRLADIMEVKRV